jgi:hypothetical protein
MEVDLFRVPTLLGGELCFGSDACELVLHAYADWAQSVPEAMSSSLMVMRYPADPALPGVLRGRHVTHVRLAYSGDDLQEGRGWLDPLRRLATPIVDTIRTMPYADVGTIHHEPVDEPVLAYDRNIFLRRLDVRGVGVLAEHVGPAAEAPFLTEIRAWRGALARPPAIANTVAGRDAAYSLLAISGPPREDRAQRDKLLDAMAPWSNGMMYLNFTGVEDADPALVPRAYRASDFARLQEVKAAYDPTNMFRINFNILPRHHTTSSKDG